jgi:hypothetical protein
MKAIALTGLALALSLPAHGATLIVPDQFSTIQSAIVSAASGDTVLVRPGTYVENLNYLGKSLTVMSEAGPAATIIDGSSPAHPDTGTVVIIPSAVPTPVLEGFTITGGTGTMGVITSHVRTGGGVVVLGEAVIRGNWITENRIENPDGTLSAYGGGIWVRASSLIEGNRIFSNLASSLVAARGGGVFARQATVDSNRIFLNTAGDFAATFCLGNGGGIHAGNEVRGNVIACNVSVCLGGGIGDSFWIEGNTIVGNRAIQRPEHSGISSPDHIARNAITHNLGKGYDCNGAEHPPRSALR